jgi:dTDP-4-amino-4,6-dideoxygalactose transaminase
MEAIEVEQNGKAAAARTQIPFARTEICEEACEAAARILRSGWVTSGPEVVAFEQELADWVQADHGVAVASCTVAIELALRALRLRPGAKVLTPTMTFCGAVHAIVHAGLRPVLVDVGNASLLPDPSTVAAAVERASGVDAMVVVHFAGHPAPVEELSAAAGLPLARVVEDAAHALGTWVDHRPVGAISAATCYSFYATKNLPIGEGGMVTTADPALADYVRQARLHGMSKDAWKRYLPGAAWYYNVDIAGLKANMTDLQAAIGRAQLRRLAGWQEQRAALAKAYDEGLAGVPGLRLPSRPERGRHAWHLYVIHVEADFGLHRDAVIAELGQRGVGCSVHFIPAHHQPYFRELLGEEGVALLPNADAAFQEILSLPMHPGLTLADVGRVCVELADLGRRRRARTNARPVGTGP